MGLIDEKKKKKFYDDQRLTAKGMSLAMESIEFAEAELQNLAIEFCQFCGKKCFYSEQRGTWIYGKIQYSTEKLFQKFIEQRKTN